MDFKTVSVIVMGVLYVVAGVNHFLSPGFYEKMLRGLLPFAPALNIISGIAEVLLGFLVILPETRVYAAWGIIVLLVAVFPANINMAVHAEKWRISATVLYLRLPLQLLLIWWAYQYTK